MGLIDNLLCRRCGAEDETSVHILCRCEALASIRHAHLGFFFLEPEDIKNQNLGAFWRFIKAAGLLWGMFRGTKGRFIKGLGASGLKGPNPLTNQSSGYGRAEGTRIKFVCPFFTAHTGSNKFNNKLLSRFWNKVLKVVNDIPLCVHLMADKFFVTTSN
jgi:hypothetical protein